MKKLTPLQITIFEAMTGWVYEEAKTTWGVDSFDLKKESERAVRISNALRLGYKIKPLPWVNGKASTAVGIFQIIPNGGKSKYTAKLLVYSSEQDDDPYVEKCFTAEDAITAADKMYKIRLMTMLEK